MVAELESSTYRRSYKFPATPTRWNLKERKDFPQWHSDLRRVVRHATAPGFLGSPPPALEWDGGGGPRTRASVRSKANSSAAHAHAHAATFTQDEWLQHNILLYDIVMASVTLTEAQLVHVENGFGSVADGNALYDWVVSHADDNKLSVQLHLKETMRKLSIGDTATADEVDEVLEVIELSWPKIKGYDNSSAAPSVEYALGLFPSSYMRASYISALQVHQDRGT
ncbi:hypothetical protein AB1Y20_018220 [Prymnesium parvum]|uniref:Uncharacterized protein n=1 Tax=Prymnesium parvum TaxID=97485 RepID=A0AB34JRB6_PRYPA